MIINTEICGHYERVMRPPPDERLARFLDQVGRRAMVIPRRVDDGEPIRYLVWLLDVPPEDLFKAHDEAATLSSSLYDPEPVPFMIGGADRVKSDQLLLERYDAIRSGPSRGTEEDP